MDRLPSAAVSMADSLDASDVESEGSWQAVDESEYYQTPMEGSRSVVTPSCTGHSG